MFRKNQLKKLVLQTVRDKGITSSKQVWARLRPLGVSHENVSMILLKCKKQRLLERILRKRGRVREYLYTITERGRKRLAYYKGNDAEARRGAVVEIDDLVEDARKEITFLWASSVEIFNDAEKLCNNTSQADVFSIGVQCATSSAYLIMNKHELISAFAAKELLSQVSPETSASIQNAIKRPTKENLFDSMEVLYVSSKLYKLYTQRIQPDFLTFLVWKRLRELHLGQWHLYRMFKKEERMKEVYRSLYEIERAQGSKLAEKSIGLHGNISALSSFSVEFLKWHSTTMDYIIKTDMKIIENLAKPVTQRDSSEVLCIIHFYIESLKENRKLAEDKRELGEEVKRLNEEIYDVQDHILRDPSIPIRAH